MTKLLQGKKIKINAIAQIYIFIINLKFKDIVIYIVILYYYK